MINQSYCQRCFSVVVTLVGVGLLSGCALRQAELPADFRPTANSNAGLITGSVSSLPDSKWRPPYYESSAYFYAGIDDPTVKGVLRSGSKHNLAVWDGVDCDADGLADECGRLFALELPAGRYRFHHVQVREPNATSIETSDRFSLALDDFSFTVVAGETIYLGNLSSRICMSSLPRGISVAAVRGEVRDQFSRDLPLLTERFPALKSTLPVRRIMAVNSWLWQRPGDPPREGWPAQCGPYPATRDTDSY